MAIIQHTDGQEAWGGTQAIQQPLTEIDEAIAAMEDLHLAAMTLIRRGHPALGWKVLGAARDLAKPLMAKDETEAVEEPSPAAPDPTVTMDPTAARLAEPKGEE